jgi:hypothetical protein
MMIKRTLTICAAVSAALVAGAAGTSLALAQGYPPPGAVYSPGPPPYPPGGYPADYRRAPPPGVPDFDALEDDRRRTRRLRPRCRRLAFPRFIPTAAIRAAPSFRPTIRVMAAPTGLRR